MKTNQILEVLKVIAWIIFIGLCVRTGSIIISFLISLLFNSEGAANLYRDMDFAPILAYSQPHYIVMICLVISISAMKAYLFYQVIQIITKLNINHPFSEFTEKLIGKMAGVAFQIGITGLIAKLYAQWIMKQSVFFTFEGGTAEFLFLAGILYVVSVIFRKGIELQSENELTI